MSSSASRFKQLAAKSGLAPWRHALSRLRHSVIIGLVLALQSCGGGAVEMNVVVFNYWPRALADVYVNGQHVGAGYGAFGPGGTGSKISCCYKVKPGSVKIDWMLGGGEGDPLTGTTRTATVSLKEIRPGADYLGVYLYADGRVLLDTARGIPDYKAL
jgi:hypothetical protein